MTIAVIGLGHVGLPTALGFASVGWQVVGTDRATDTLELIAQGTAPFWEVGLQEMLEEQLRAGRFRVTANLGEAMRAAGTIFVCVSTPQDSLGGADLSQIEAVARAIAQHQNGYKLVVEKSTTPVRTAERIKQTLARYRNDSHESDVAVNPEFLQEGSALHDVLHPDRIVIGVESDRARDRLIQIYAPVLAGLPAPGMCAECVRIGRTHPPDRRLIITSLATAELIKHAANAFLATKISYINLIADICEATGGNVEEVARGLGLDPRIGPHFLKAGLGYGGYCLPKDLLAFIRIAEEHDIDSGLLKEVARVNDRRIEVLMSKVREVLWVLRDKTIAVFGLAYKPGTDDVREAPSLKLLSRLVAEGTSLRVHDPKAIANARRVLPEDPPRVVYCSSPYDAAVGAHAVLIVTEWGEYRTLDFQRLRSVMEVPAIIDGRNLLDPSAIRQLGFEYVSVGRA